MSAKKKEQTRFYEAKKRSEVEQAFAADKKKLRFEGYVPVQETWSEPDREYPGLGSQAWRYMTRRVLPEHPELVKLSNKPPTERFVRLEVVYAPVEQAARSKGGQLDIVVTNNGRCPTCDLPTMQMPRPPYERYCNECKAEFPS